MKSVHVKAQKLDCVMAVTTCFLFLAPVLSAQQTTHRFWDKTNIILHSANAAAQTADAISTQRFLRLGFRETNPLARSLVTRGWKGQVAASYGLGVGGTLLGGAPFAVQSIAKIGGQLSAGSHYFHGRKS